MPTVYGAVDLVKNELRNAVMQNLGSAPAAPVKGLMYFNSADNTFYWYDGTQWIAAKAAAGAIPSDTVTTAAIGDAPVPGASTLFSRGDHKHGMPGFGAITVEQTFGSSSTNGAATTLARSDHAHGNPVHDNAAHAAVSRSALAPPTADISMGGFKLVSLGTPTAGTDAVTKAYVDAGISGLAWKDTVRIASTANVALTGLVAIDGVTPVATDRILLKNQTAPAENGIWVAAAGAWARATDAATATDILNAAVFVSEGTVNADTAWVMTTNAPITVGTTGLTWAQFGAGAVYSAGNGLTLTANTFDVGAGTGILVAADTVAVDTAVIATRAYVDSGIGTTALTTAGAGLTKTGQSVDVVAGDTSLTVAADSIIVNTAVIASRSYVDSGIGTTALTTAGNGLTKTGQTVDVVGGTGITVAADLVSVDTTVIATRSYVDTAVTGVTKKYATALTGTASPETVTHNLNTRDVHVAVYNGSTPYTAVEVDWDAATVNTVTIRYNPNLGAGYRVVVIG